MFDKNGLATKTFKILVYTYNAENEFNGSLYLQIEEGTGIPAQTTLVRPNERKDGFTQVFNEDKQEWEYIEDHRYDDVYDINTKQKADIKYLGALKPEHTLIAPPSYDHEFIDGEWIITEEKKAELEALEKQRELQQLHDDLETLERDIARLERIRDRNDDEEAKLQQLYDDSTQLYRDIQAIEND